MRTTTALAQRQARWRRRRNTIGAACAALMLSSVGLHTAASAQSTDGFIPGEATATAKSFGISLSPGGGSPLEVGLGNSVARYQNRTATAEGTALSLGLLALFLGPSSQCSELPPLIPEDQIPPITLGDSRRANPATQPLEVRVPGDANGPGGVIGSQFANATAEPQASGAQTTTVSQDWGLVALDNGSTDVTTSLVNGVREARAVMTGSRLRVLGDIFIINEPRWEAVAQSGASTKTEGSFTFKSATIFGIERPASLFPQEFRDLTAGISQFLGFLGVVIKYPTVEVTEGKVTVTPLSVGVKNPPIGEGFLKPILDALAPYKDEAFRKQIEQDCNQGGPLQIVDLALSVLKGTGEVSVNVGGVSAFTAATEFPEPPPLELPDLTLDSEVVLSDPEPYVAPQVLSGSTSSGSSYSGSSGSSFDSSGSFSDTAPMDVAAPAPETTAAVTTTTESATPDAVLAASRVVPGKTGGAAALVGGIGLGGLVLLAGADRFIMGRTKREIPD